MAYRVELRNSARKALLRFPKEIQRGIFDAIADLATNPRPQGCVKLAGTINSYRIRVGSYRIIYSIRDDLLLVMVIKVGHRRDIYR